MRGFSTMFHSSPSAKSSVPQSHGVKLLGQHLFQNIVARGDQYKCSAWDALFAAKSEVGEDTFLDLQVVHDALSIDREELAEVIDHIVPLSLEWVSRAKSYKSQAKDFLTAVQRTLQQGRPQQEAPPTLTQPPTTIQISKESALEHCHRDVVECTNCLVQFTQIPQGTTHHVTSCPCSIRRTLISNEPVLGTAETETKYNDATHDSPPLGIKFPMPVPSQVSVYMWPDDDFFGWLEYVINSLDSSIDVPTMRELLMSVTAPLDKETKQAIGGLMKSAGCDMDGDFFMNELLRRHSRYNASLSSTPRGPSLDFSQSQHVRSKSIKSTASSNASTTSSSESDASSESASSSSSASPGRAQDKTPPAPRSPLRLKIKASGSVPLSKELVRLLEALCPNEAYNRVGKEAGVSLDNLSETSSILVSPYGPSRSTTLDSIP